MTSRSESRSRIVAVSAICVVVVALAGFAVSQQGRAGASTVFDGNGTDGSSTNTAPSSGVGVGVSSPTVVAWPPFGISHTTFVAQGLSNAQGSAHAYALNPAAVWSIAAIKRAATTFALSASPRHQGGMWLVGNGADGTSLSVQADGWASLMYSNGLVRGCAVAVPESSGAIPESKGATPGCSGSTNPASGPALSTAAAQTKVASLLAALQPTLTSVHYTVNSDRPSGSTWVMAQAMVDGQPAGMTWNAAFAGRRLTSFSGPLAPMVDLGSFPVVSPRAAVMRLSDPRFGPLVTGPIPMMNAASGAVAPTSAAPAPDTPVSNVPQPRTTPPAIPSPGSAIAWPVATETITSAVLVRQPLTTPNGAVLLVPTYQLSSTDHRTWQVLAVADSGLNFSPPPVATPATGSAVR